MIDRNTKSATPASHNEIAIVAAFQLAGGGDGAAQPLLGSRLHLSGRLSGAPANSADATDRGTDHHSGFLANENSLSEKPRPMRPRP